MKGGLPRLMERGTQSRTTGRGASRGDPTSNQIL